MTSKLQGNWVLDEWKTNMDNNLHNRESHTRSPDLSSFFSSFVLSWECCSLAFDVPRVSLAGMKKRKMLNSIIIITVRSMKLEKWETCDQLNWWDLGLPRTNQASYKTDEWIELSLRAKFTINTKLRCILYCLETKVYQGRNKIWIPLAQWANKCQFPLAQLKYYLLTIRHGSQYGNQRTNINKVCLDS